MRAMSWLRNSLTRLGLVPVRLLGRLPLPAARALVRPLAGPLYVLMRRRRAIAARNLELCFPELDDRGRRDLLRRHFRNLAEMLAEIAVAWVRPGRLPEAWGRVEGLEHLSAARERGGVLLLTGHTTCLELGARLLGARLLGEQVPARSIYRPLANPVLENFQNRGRARYAEAMIPRRDLRSMVRYLREGGVLWFAPDQDVGASGSLFAPFFGVPTATTMAVLELLRLGRAVLVPMYPIKDEDSGQVTVHIDPAVTGLPSDNPAADLARINTLLETRIRQAPAQYWWLHRRFKTRPAGEPSPYGDVEEKR